MSSGRFLNKSLKLDWVFLLVTFALMVLIYWASSRTTTSK